MGQAAKEIQPIHGTQTHTINETPITMRAKFEQTWPLVRDELLDHLKGEGMPEDVAVWYEKSLNYNVPGGKLIRAFAVISTAETLKGRPLTDAEYLKVAVLGWCIELLQACFLVVDDIMDQGITRRGHACWYRVDNAGNIALNDALMIECAIFHLLRAHFRTESYYVDVLELFHETAYKTEMGQSVDMISSGSPTHSNRVDLARFSFERYKTLAAYKTAYYSFYLPIALGMHFCGIPTIYTVGSHTIHPYDTALSISSILGVYYTALDDVLDFSCTVEQIGKVGTDIIENKCTWAIVTALTLASPEQRRVLDENYGRKDPENEKRVKELYGELGIVGRFDVYEKEVLEKLEMMIADIPVEDGRSGILTREVFSCFTDKMGKRSK